MPDRLDDSSRPLSRHKGRDFGGAILLCPALLLALLGGCGEARRGLGYEATQRLQQRCLALLPAEDGAVLVMDPRDGRVLVMTNPEWAVGQRFPPGSTFKLVSALAALGEEKASPDRGVDCPGYFVFQGETLDCGHVHGRVNLTQALAYSCNTYFYTLGSRVGWEALADCARRCELDSETGINRPGEVSGAIPLALTERQAVDFSIGEGGWVQVTPIALASLVAGIANGGKRFVPQAAQDRESLRRFRPKAGSTLPFTQFLPVLREGMREAVGYGTCTEARLPGIAVAGKTGTATEVGGGGKTHSWFLGFAPFDRPRFVVLVFNKRGLGQTTSAPLGREVLRACFDEETK